MIFTKIQYKIYDGKILAIVEVFKTNKYYLKSYKYEIFIITDHWALSKSGGLKNYPSTTFK